VVNLGMTGGIENFDDIFSVFVGPKGVDVDGQSFSIKLCVVCV